MAAATTDIPGIGPVAAASLAEHGYRTLKKLASASVEKLASVPGFSTARAGKVIAAARELLPANNDTKGAGAQRPDKGKDKRGKKDKKDKKKGKGKGKGKGKDKKNKKKDKKDKRGKKDKKGKKGKKDKKKGKKNKK